MDNKKAFEMYSEAYNRGERKNSAMQLGIMHYYGVLGPVDYEKAFNLFQESVRSCLLFGS